MGFVAGMPHFGHAAFCRQAVFLYTIALKENLYCFCKRLPGGLRAAPQVPSDPHLLKGKREEENTLKGRNPWDACTRIPHTAAPA